MAKWLAIAEVALRVIAAIIKALGSAGALPAEIAAERVAKARERQDTGDKV